MQGSFHKSATGDTVDDAMSDAKGDVGLSRAFGQKKGVRPGGRTGRQRSDDLEREER